MFSPGWASALRFVRGSARPWTFATSCGHIVFVLEGGTKHRACFLVVEDDALQARTMARLLREYGSVSVAHTLAEATERSTDRALTAALVDVKLPDGDGLAFVEALRSSRPTVPILVLTGCVDREHINRTHLLGAEYVCKPPLLENIESFAKRAMVPAAPPGDPEALTLEWARCHGLSKNETEVIRLVVMGVPRSGIPRKMGVSDNTVKTYVRRLLGKSGAESVEALARRILTEGLTA